MEIRERIANESTRMIDLFRSGHLPRRLDSQAEWSIKPGFAAVDAPIVCMTVQRATLQPGGDSAFAAIRRLPQQHADGLGKKDVSLTTFLARGRHGLSDEARAFITIALGVLPVRPAAPGAVRFTPAPKRLASGPALKVDLRFRGAFSALPAKC